MDKKTIIITGSTRGIGLGLAKEFSSIGHNIVLNGRSKDKVEEAVLDIKKSNPGVIGVSGSVVDEDTHLRLIEEAMTTFGKVDIWINNAGIPQSHKSFIDLESETLKNVNEINVFGLMLGTKIAANHMLGQGFGKIFNMEGFGSDGRMMDKLSLYGTSKRAVNYFSKSVSKELKNSPIQIGILSPGMVRTDFINTSMESGSPEEIKRFRKVYDILAEDVEPVTKFLVQGVLKSTKNYDRIVFLTKMKLIGKIFRMMVAK